MKKRRATTTSMAVSNLYRLLCPKLTVALCVLLCLLAFLRIHHQLKLQSSSFLSIQKSTRAFGDNDVFNDPPKIAFLFLARRNLPLDFLWGHFFKKGDVAKFSIYIHSEPGFVFDESTTKSAFFYGRHLKNSIQVEWGESTMIEAERLLFEEALLDPSNQRFVLLSDSCVPLYNFSYTYNYIMSSPKSFVDSFLNVNENRYSPKMSPTIPKEKWRKGTQWVALIRTHAEVIVNDSIVFPLFRKFCKRWPRFPPERHLLKMDFKFNQQMMDSPRNCIPDEHYVQTLLAMNGHDDEIEPRALTYSIWNQSVIKRGRRSWHPVTLNYADATPLHIKEIKDIDHINYELEHRTEWCRANSRFTNCFLFARKFTPNAAMRLLNDGLVGPLDDASNSVSDNNLT